MLSAAMLSAAMLSAAIWIVAPVPAWAATVQGPARAEFKLSDNRLLPGDSSTVELTLSIADGWHINAIDPGLKFLVPASLDFKLPEGVSVSELTWPVPQRTRVRFAGGNDIYTHEGSITVSGQLHYDSIAPAGGRAVAILGYQACNETLCLRPETIRVPLAIEFVPLQAAEHAGPGYYSNLGHHAGLALGGLSRDGSRALLLGLLLVGLAINLVPCVGPLLGSSARALDQVSSSGSLRASVGLLAYAVGSSLVLASLVGVAASLESGPLAGNSVVYRAALAMLVVALCSLGLAVRSPRSVPGSAVAWLFLAGMAAGLLGAPLVALVTVAISKTGASQPWVLAAAAAVVALLPSLALVMLARSGADADTVPAWVEHLFGCALLVVACRLAAPVLPEPLSTSLVPAFVFLAALYIGLVDRPGPLSISAGSLARTAGAALLLVATASVAAPAPQATGLAWQEFSAEVYDANQRSGRPMVMEFTADWCLPCQEMKEQTFSDEGVVRASEGIDLLSVDITAINDFVDRVMKSFKVQSAPTTIFFDSSGKEVTRRAGFIGAADFIRLLRQAGEGTPAKTGI
ncbi:MAG: protein-disulfide reductase DsbD domain-containing protein [bacterium]